MGEGEGWKFAVSYGVVREGLTEKAIAEPIYEGKER